MDFHQIKGFGGAVAPLAPPPSTSVIVVVYCRLVVHADAIIAAQ